MDVNVARWRDELVKMIFMFAHLQSPLWLSLWDGFILFNRIERQQTLAHIRIQWRRCVAPRSDQERFFRIENNCENTVKCRSSLTFWISHFNSIESNTLDSHWTSYICRPGTLALIHMRRFIAENSENRLNRYDGCKTTVCTSTDSIAKRWRRERNIHTCASSYTDFTLYLKFTCVGRRRRRYPIRSLLPLCVCSAPHTYIVQSHSIREMIIIIFITVCCVYASECVCVCLSLLFCQRMPGCFSFTNSNWNAQVRFNCARERVCVCVFARNGEIRSPQLDGGYSQVATRTRTQCSRSNNLVSLLLD